ncbi:hypothetical protein F5Y16DRAFT_354655 [Xylariaceae sp. FL0255]|nr:hypothetical protein F5Y16DRAFT_354655 [Xylariaceae sp. FL0255]
MAMNAVNRLIVCVDESDFAEDGTLGYGNTSNIFKIKSLAVTGASTIHNENRNVTQTVRYYQVFKKDAPTGFARFQKGASSGASIDQQIKLIVEDVCRISERRHVELFMYGAGQGAYIAQVAASLLHSIGVPNSAADFEQLYQTALALEDASKASNTQGSAKLSAYLKAHSYAPIHIKFLGLFDALRIPVDKQEYEPSFVGAIENFRHALAFNDTRTAPYIWETPKTEELGNRSFIQAWFVGTHRDICGGHEHDGLSLFPIQWMIFESIKAGLIFRSNSSSANILSTIFPQFVGRLPTLQAEEKAQWHIKHTNGIEVVMFDLQSVQGQSKVGPDHSINIRSKGSQKNQRAVFSETHELLGWSQDSPHGNILHPSMFTILDRHPSYYDQGLFKIRKLDISAFLERIDDQDRPMPWLDGFLLQESSVQAFRILVCGKTGVGKSTLINKVFGVEMTEESLSYSQGQHDINKAFSSLANPGLLIHDSKGWQAGSDVELNEIAKFLRHRAFQKNPAESLHVIWFCVDSDVSRIEEADRRTFQTIAQYSSQVPVFVVGTKKDKLVAIRKMELLEQYMQKTDNYKEASLWANMEANESADKQFVQLRDQLSTLDHYKADGFCCISKDDEEGIRKLLSDTLDILADERVRVFCVAAQVMDVEQKIDQAITEVMRLGVHAIRTAMVPLPASGLIGTPTVSRILCEHIIQCFGFPKATPEAVEEIMSRVVMKNLKSFMRVSLTQFGTISAATLGAAIPTAGIGAVLGIAGCMLAAPPTARMLLKCACDMILILERSFRYQGKWVSVKQIEDAAAYYTTAKTSADGRDHYLQEHVHREVDNLVPLRKFGVGFKFGNLRTGLQSIIYENRYDKLEENKPASRVSSNQLAGSPNLSVEQQRSASSSPAFTNTTSSKSPMTMTSLLSQGVPTLSSTTPTTPTGYYGANSPPPPAYPPQPNESNMKFMSGTMPGSFHMIPELDSRTIQPLPAELEGTSLRDPNAYSELAGDSAFPGQTHPDYSSPLGPAPIRAPTMQLEGTLYTPAVATPGNNQLYPPTGSGIYGDMMSNKSSTSLGTNSMRSSGDFTATPVKEKKSSTDLLRRSMGKLGFKRS